MFILLWNIFQLWQMNLHMNCIAIVFDYSLEKAESKMSSSSVSMGKGVKLRSKKSGLGVKVFNNANGSGKSRIGITPWLKRKWVSISVGTKACSQYRHLTVPSSSFWTRASTSSSWGLELVCRTCTLFHGRIPWKIAVMIGISTSILEVTSC